MALRSLEYAGRRAAFSVLCGRPSTSQFLRRSEMNSVSSLQALSVRAILDSNKITNFRSSPRSSAITIQNSIVSPGIHIPPHFHFDKVPKKLPDWWDDEDDEDDGETVKVMMGDGGNSGKTGGEDGGGGYGSSGGNGTGGGGHGEEGFFAGLLAMYVRAVTKYPIRTKAISTSLLAALGDILAQAIAQNGSGKFVLDVRRTASIGLWGFVVMGPWLHAWYALLDKFFYGKYAVAWKVLFDQFVFSPVFVAAFILGVGKLEGHATTEVLGNVRDKLWPSMKANWTLWPAAQVINFWIIPKSFQIVYVNFVSLIWSVILAYIAHEQEAAS